MGLAVRRYCLSHALRAQRPSALLTHGQKEPGASQQPAALTKLITFISLIGWLQKSFKNRDKNGE
ncbi:MAG: hypothetical protein AB8B36_07915 [Prochlorococcus sp.]